MFSAADHAFMQQALDMARQAEAQGEVPVGAVLVDAGGQVLAAAGNQSIRACDPTAHAEVVALREAAQKQENYRLVKTTLYVTLEPCAMCVGALIHARVKRVIYAATDLKAGAVSSQLHLLEAPHFNHSIECQGGLLAVEASKLLKAFFKRRR